jgi:transcriptional regulator MraZ
MPKRCGRKWESATGKWKSETDKWDTLKRGLLYGSHEISIDTKNRMLVPAEIRQSIDQARDGNCFFAIIGYNGKIWLYPDKYYEELVSRETPALLPTDEALEFDHLNFSAANLLSVDAQFRVLLPERLMKNSRTEKSVTVIGAKDHAEIWNRTEWDARFDDLQKRRKEIAEQKRKDIKPDEPRADP